MQKKKKKKKRENKKRKNYNKNGQGAGGICSIKVPRSRPLIYANHRPIPAFITNRKKELC